VLRIFGPEREEENEAGEKYIQRCFIICTSIGYLGRSNTMRLARHVACVEKLEMLGTTTYLRKNLKESNHLEYLGADVKII
jgi:hypothetical protein